MPSLLPRFHRSGARTLLPLALLAVAPSAHAQVYSGSDESGTIVLSNFRTAETPHLLIEAPQPSPIELPSTLAPQLAVPLKLPRAPVPAARAKEFEAMVRRVAREVAVSPELLHAVITVESGYNPLAVSPKGAKGLMQLMPETALRFGALNLFDPQQNVRAGARYLKWLLQLFGGDVRLALAGYNAGEDAVMHAGYRIPPFPETIDYVPKVLSRLSPLRG